MKRAIALLMCAAAGASVAAPVPAPEQLAACRNGALPLHRSQPAPVVDFSGALPIPDYLDTIIGCESIWPGVPTAPPPKSAWLESERSLYQDTVAKRQVDVLVAPFQTQGYGLDRIERSLMTAELAYAIGDATQYAVADPFLVARALGEGARRLDRLDIERLARKIGAKTILVGYVGHDLHHAFTLTLELQHVVSGSIYETFWRRDWRAVSFTDDRTPAFVLNEMLPQVLSALPLKLEAHRASKGSVRPGGLLRITQTPEELISAGGSASAARPAASFDLLGALTPFESEAAREREFERATLASFAIDRPSPTDRFLMAYALAQLARRPAALATLKGLRSREATALTALLNGDLPAAEKAVARVPQSLQRLLLDFGLRNLEAFYGEKLRAGPAAAEEVFGQAGAAWDSLIRLQVRDLDAWAVANPLTIKRLLDLSFPYPGLDADSLLRGDAVAQGAMPDDVEIDLANERHVRRATSQIVPAECCKSRRLRPQNWDLLWLFEGLSEARISANLTHLTYLEGLPNSALREISRYEPLLGGLPVLEVSRAKAALALYQSAADDMRGSWHDQLEQSAAMAAWNSPGQTGVAYEALVTMGIPSPESELLVDAYGYDYPRRPYWPMWFFGIDSDRHQQRAVDLALEALAFSDKDVTPLRSLPPGNQPEHADAVIASLGSRFTGNPQRPSMGDGLQSKRTDDLIRQLEVAIKRDPMNWDNYEALAEYIVGSGGAYERARDAVLKYPGFHDSQPDDPVALSNYAYQAGSLLYWQGQPALAEPLYRISADLNTGSDASLTSEAMLEMMRGDYVGAAQILRQDAIRYDSAGAYRDYLSLLHAFGASDAAWQGFSQTKAAFEVPQVWVAALVGQQRQGFTNEAVRQWLMRPEIRDAQFHTFRFAPYYAVLWYATERTPPADLGKFVEQLEGPPVAKIDVDGSTLLVPSDQQEGFFQAVRPSPFRAGKSPKLPQDTPVKSDLAYFADGYAALRRGDYDTAVGRFIAMADRYPVEGYVLGYFAYAAAKSGDKEHLEAYIDSRKGPRDFDSWLAKAFFAGARGDVKTALAALQSAFRVRPSTEYRPVLTAYEYAQACEWLLKDTGDSRFKAALLDWVKKYEVIQPTHAWAYAIEYAYEKPGPERLRALALARYLDPRSDRIRSASKDELNQAQSWLRDHDPFRVPDRAPDHSRAKTAALERMGDRSS